MFDPWVGKIPWRRAWQSSPVFLPRESHGQRSLGCYSPWGHKEWDASEQLNTQYEEGPSCSRVLEEAHEAGQGIWVGLLRDFEAYERVVAGEMEKQTEVWRIIEVSHTGSQEWTAWVTKRTCEPFMVIGNSGEATGWIPFPHDICQKMFKWKCKSGKLVNGGWIMKELGIGLII